MDHRGCNRDHSIPKMAPQQGVGGKSLISASTKAVSSTGGSFSLVMADVTPHLLLQEVSWVPG